MDIVAERSPEQQHSTTTYAHTPGKSRSSKSLSTISDRVACCSLWGRLITFNYLPPMHVPCLKRNPTFFPFLEKIDKRGKKGCISQRGSVTSDLCWLPVIADLEGAACVPGNVDWCECREHVGSFTFNTQG